MGAAAISRRGLLRGASLAAAALLVADLSSCALADPDLARADVSRAQPDPKTIPAVVRASCAFSIDLVRASVRDANLVCSPLSALVALAMVRNGAIGQTATEMDRTLHLPGLARLNAGLNAMTQTLDHLNGTRRRPDGSKTKVSLDLVNAVWGQTGVSWQAPFLAALASSYGTGVLETDFAANPDRAARRVNAWVADQTADRIKNMVPPGVINDATVLVLANALYLKAGWREALTPAGDRPFRAPGGLVHAPALTGMVVGCATEGPGWTSARIPCAGDELAMTVILPKGDLASLLKNLTSERLAGLLVDPAPVLVDLTLPGFTFGSIVPLTQVLQDLGMPRAFSGAAELPGLTADLQLQLDQVLHQGWISVDENGMEAAAATVVTAVAVSAGPAAERTVVLDRPFLFCLHDTVVGTPLVLGVVNDPTQR